MMKSRQFIATLKKIATEYRTKYMWGGIGGPITQTYITDRANQYPRYYSPTYIKQLQATIGKGYFGFDCIGVIKAILWGWSGDASKYWGGITYLSNGVPDVGADWTDKMLLDRSTDMSTVKVGDAVCFPGHIGVYIGDGKVVEATTNFGGGVVISQLAGRGWKSHGRLPWVDYSDQTETSAGTRNYTVKVTDTDAYWGIAMRELSDPMRYTEILSLNNLKATDHLIAGQVIKLPASTVTPAPTPKPATDFSRCAIAHGATGAQVDLLQNALVLNGHDLKIDGSFGDKTLAAVKEYQTANKITADGHVGAATWSKILSRGL